MALCNYHDEALEEQRTIMENPQNHQFVVSPSDYHHDARADHGRKKATTAHQRSSSQFSVFQQEHITSKHSFFDNDEFEGSPESSDFARVNPLPLKAQIDARVGLKGGATQRGASQLRVEPPRQRPGKRTSIHSHGPAKPLSTARLSTYSRRSKLSVFRSSDGNMNPGNAPSTPITAVRSGARHKRTVSFNHRRRHKPSDDGNDVASFDSGFDATPSESPDIPSSPPVVKGNEPTSSLKLASVALPTPRTRRLREFDVEARKCSYELEKVMDDAFYRSSSTSSKSARSSGCDAAGGFGETPPSSVSNKSSAGARKLDRDILDRPLPPTPTDQDSPKRLNTREELTRLRKKVAMIYKDEISTGNGHAINDILSNLDRLTQKSQPDSRRGIHPARLGSATYTSADEFNYLQSIPEEDRGAEDSYVSASSLGDEELATLFGVGSTGSHVPMRYGRSTILPVEPSSPASPHPWAPLRIRKVSDQTPAARQDATTRPDPFDLNLASTLIVGDGKGIHLLTISAGELTL
jgi:serine/threonine-protein kinase HSL1 (negative regulator of Swe1 kinase)